ncbi:FmdB family zinc ribbon protein [Actinopolymorpha sp. B17G11]|uniref:FmdB family zinc ribbon protein n=1 Tax=unclassified Actinopolymorpha TaxID=2627063 RepID=UPI0032D988A0
MPTYQYACVDCDEQLEVVQKFTDDPLRECPTCAGRLRKVFSAVGVVFKGSGFYRNDSRSDGRGKKSSESSSSNGESKSSDSSSSSGSSDASSSGGSKSSDGKSGDKATSSSSSGASSSSSATPSKSGSAA